MTLSDLVTEWIEARSLNLAASTISGYRRLHRLYIEPVYVGGVELSALDTSDMLDLLRPLIARGCTRQAQLLQVLVSAALHNAIKKRLLSYNPMDALDKVRHRSQVTPWLTVDQARQLLTSSAEAHDPYYVAWLLMLCCGLRRGEMLALKWSDIDEARAVLHVQRQRTVVDCRSTISRPKSLSSIRDIPLADHLLTILRLQPRASDDIMDGVTRTMLARGLDKALSRAGLPRVTLHGLRHTMASVAVEADVDIKVLQSLMGHAHYQTTADIYAHVNQQPRTQAAATIANALIGARLEIA